MLVPWKATKKKYEVKDIAGFIEGEAWEGTWKVSWLPLLQGSRLILGIVSGVLTTVTNGVVTESCIDKN